MLRRDQCSPSLVITTSNYISISIDAFINRFIALALIRIVFIYNVLPASKTVKYLSALDVVVIGIIA